jgi:ubiquinone/menaquinone biosynthesis C-methylase UbiE
MNAPLTRSSSKPSRRHQAGHILTGTLPADGTAPSSTSPIAHALWPQAVPDYLHDNYWWAYEHPRGVKFFDREWIVNLILFGNMAKLRDLALAEFDNKLEGRTLQVAAVYGDFTPKLVECIQPGGSLDVIDVLPVQLANTRRKLPPNAPVTLHNRNSNDLKFDDRTFDQVIVFFLMHEQPDGVREKTMQEAVRVLKPGGKLVMVDYHRPHRWSPMRYFFEPILDWLEPFAVALWYRPLADLLPKDRTLKPLNHHTVFGGLYQKTAFRLE